MLLNQLEMNKRMLSVLVVWMLKNGGPFHTSHYEENLVVFLWIDLESSHELFI